MTFGEFGKKTEEVFNGLVQQGLRRGDRIAIVSESRPEWLMIEFAALALGATVVPMFPTLTPDQIQFIVADCGARILVVSNDLQLGKANKICKDCPELQSVILLNDEKKLSPPSNISFLHLKELRIASAGALNFEEELQKAKPDDLVAIIYTSGTTGTPKGVMLSHHNILSNLQGAIDVLPEIGEDDIALSFLPLCHAFEHIAMHLFLVKGFVVGFAESIDTVADNLVEIRPTVMTGVPRFYERVYTRLMRRRESLKGTQRTIFDWALRVGAKNGLAIEGKPVPYWAKLCKPIADALVLRKIRERTGGRMRFFVSGAAALPAEVGRAFASFGLTVIEGYGMTEASPIISVNPYNKVKWGTVGKPLSNVEVRIAHDGEILARGPNVMKGYYNHPEGTSEVIDADGWLHTGDVGEIDAGGYIKITDRKKHLFVSSGGKNIAPAPIETALTESNLIEQIMLVGDKRPFCTALIVPDYAALRENGIARGEDQSSEGLATNEKVRRAIEQELDRLQKGFATYERVRRFILLPEQFTVENGMMTPTLKIRRKAVEERYQKLIESMYRLRPVEAD